MLNTCRNAPTLSKYISHLQEHDSARTQGVYNKGRPLHQLPFKTPCRAAFSVNANIVINTIYKGILPRYTNCTRSSLQLGSMLGAADGTTVVGDSHNCSIPSLPKELVNHSATNHASIKKIQASVTGVFTRISTVRVINPGTGVSTLAYAQHDSGSEVTLVSASLSDELSLRRGETSVVTLHTVSGSKTSTFSQVFMKVQTLHNGDQFNINKALVMPAWSDESYTLPHHYNLSSFSQFDNVDKRKLPHRSNVDILLGLDNSNLDESLRRADRRGRRASRYRDSYWLDCFWRKILRRPVSYRSRRIAV